SPNFIISCPLSAAMAAQLLQPRENFAAVVRARTSSFSSFLAFPRPPTSGMSANPRKKPAMAFECPSWRPIEIAECPTEPIGLTHEPQDRMLSNASQSLFTRRAPWYAWYEAAPGKFGMSEYGISGAGSSSRGPCWCPVGSINVNGLLLTYAYRFSPSLVLVSA